MTACPSSDWIRTTIWPRGVVSPGPERVGIAADLAQVLALQPFGGELDGRQWILDLVGDAARDIRPCRLALRGEQLRHLVERDDITLDLAFLLLGGNAREQDVVASAA